MVLERENHFKWFPHSFHLSMFFQNAEKVQQNLPALVVTLGRGKRNQSSEMLKWPWFKEGRDLERKRPQWRISPQNLYETVPWSLVQVVHEQGASKGLAKNSCWEDWLLNRDFRGHTAPRKYWDSYPAEREDTGDPLCFPLRSRKPHFRIKTVP